MSVHPPGTRWYHSVWRWHFYAGLFCIPFVIWLALTGTVYLWKPQIEAWLDRPYQHLAITGHAASPDAQVATALRAVPGSRLHKYVLPPARDGAVNILVTRDGADQRVYLNPQTLDVLRVVTEESRPMRVIFHLHGELLAGAWGSYMVEIASCWAIVMLLTGLYLWWPRGVRGMAGLLYPRVRGGKRLFWRDLHAVAGIWVAAAAMGLILTGLPWAKAWGGYLTEIRQVTGTTGGPIDWSVGGRMPTARPARGDHDGHGMAGMPIEASRAATPIRVGELARVIAATRPLAIAPPVLIAPPATAGAPWSISSDAADRTLRSNVTIDGSTGQVIKRVDFPQRHWIDRLVGYGIALHEGAYFGILNQLLGTITALLLVLLAISGAILWWRRRPIGLLGAPIPLRRPRRGAILIAAIAGLGLYLPMFGITLLAVLVVERLVLRRLTPIRIWLGLRPLGTP